MSNVLHFPTFKLYHARITNRSGSISLHSDTALSKEKAEEYFHKKHPNAQKIEVWLDRNEIGEQK